MQRTITIIAAAAVLLVGAAVSNPSAQQQAPGVLSVLSKGQPVTVNEAGGRYEISILSQGPQVLGQKVIEVGHDFLVVQDVVGVTETRIPIWSIKAVTVFRQPTR